MVIYRPSSEHGRMVDSFIREFQSRYPQVRIETLNIDSRDGIATATLYDIVQYPAIMVLQDNGFAQNIWQGEQLPLMDEIFAYAHV